MNIETLEEINNICLSSIREEKFLKLCIPKLQILICGSFDMTQIVYSKKESKLNIFLDLLKKANLHILNLTT